MQMQLTNSKALSSNIGIIGQCEPVMAPNHGVYIGKTLIYRIPFFLDSSLLINPHMALLGMTGSGKSYFIKSYLIRSRLSRQSSVFILDWNGEYDEIVKYLDGTVMRLGDNCPLDVFLNENPDLDIFSGVTSVSLASLRNDNERKLAANAIMDILVEVMHREKFARTHNRIVLLDEAWKLLNGGGALSQLFREGRKYGFAIIVASQLAKDISNEIISNVACIALFRLQNRDDYSILVDSGVIAMEHMSRLSELPVGSCMLHLATKENPKEPTKFFIGRVDGVEASIYTIKGDKMQVKISSHGFIKATETILADKSAQIKVISFIEANDRKLDTINFIRFLLKLRIDRPTIVGYLRLLGFDDLTIIDAYETAIGEVLELEQEQC